MVRRPLHRCAPFGRLKHWPFGNDRFLMRSLQKLRAPRDRDIAFSLSRKKPGVSRARTTPQERRELGNRSHDLRLMSGSDFANYQDGRAFQLEGQSILLHRSQRTAAFALVR